MRSDAVFGCGAFTAVEGRAERILCLSAEDRRSVCRAKGEGSEPAEQPMAELPVRIKEKHGGGKGRNAERLGVLRRSRLRDHRPVFARNDQNRHDRQRTQDHGHHAIHDRLRRDRRSDQKRDGFLSELGVLHAAERRQFARILYRRSCDPHRVQKRERQTDLRQGVQGDQGDAARRLQPA